MDLVFEPEAADCLNRLARDPSAERIHDSIWDLLDLIEDDSPSPLLRKQSLRTESGDKLWLIPVPGHFKDERWIILWRAQGQEALIAYVGPDSFRSMGR